MSLRDAATAPAAGFTNHRFQISQMVRNKAAMTTPIANARMKASQSITEVPILVQNIGLQFTKEPGVFYQALPIHLGVTYPLNDLKVKPCVSQPLSDRCKSPGS